MRGGNFTDAELRAIDIVYRAAGVPRCPHDEKPLVSTTWTDRNHRMVYFVCRACSRIGAIGYEGNDPSVPGRPATRSSASSRPPPR